MQLNLIVVGFTILSKLIVSDPIYAENRMEAVKDKWQINGQGLESFETKNPNLSQLKKIFKGLRIQTGLTLMPIIWDSPKNIFPNRYPYNTADVYIAFYEGKKELFRTWCDGLIYICMVDDITGKTYFDENRIIKKSTINTYSNQIRFTFLDSRFHTKNGVHVGATIKELIAAYPKNKGLKVMRIWDIDEIVFAEIVCFEKQNNSPLEDIHFLSFTVRPIGANKQVGFYKKGEYISTKLDLGAKINAITNGYECNPVEST